MPKKHLNKKGRIILIVIVCLLVLLVAVRIALPYILLKAVNKELTRIKGYSGHVNDLDVALLRGAYTLKEIKLNKTGGKIPVPFFSADIIDLSIEWKSLFHGALVGKIIVDHAVLNFVKGPTEATTENKIDSSWIDVVKNLMPLKLNRFEINRSEIHYRDFHSDPKVDLHTLDVHILAENLSNAKHNDQLLPSTVEATAGVYRGKANLKMKLNALSRVPAFEMKAEMTSLDITNLNNFLQAYAGFDVKQGNISIYTEAATKDSLITGYVKPIIKELKVVNWEKDKDKPLKIAWEAVIGSVAWVFKNHGKDQLATKVEFEGNLKSPSINIWGIIGQVLHNAFIQALYPSLENSVNINSVTAEEKKHPNIFQKVFKNKSSKSAKKKNKKGKEK